MSAAMNVRPATVTVIDTTTASPARPTCVSRSYVKGHIPVLPRGLQTVGEGAQCGYPGGVDKLCIHPQGWRAGPVDGDDRHRPQPGVHLPWHR